MTLGCPICRYFGQLDTKSYQNGKIPKLTMDRTLCRMARNEPGMSYLSIFWPIWTKKLTKMKRYQNSPWIKHCTKWPEMTLGCHICRYLGQFDPKSWSKWKVTKTHLGSNIAPNDPKWPCDVIFVFIWADMAQEVVQNGKIPKLALDRTLHQMARNDPAMSYLSIFWPIWPKKLTKIERYQNSSWLEHCTKWPEMTLGCHICRYFGQFVPKSWPKWKDSKTHLGSNIAPNDPKWPCDVIFVDILANLTQKVDQNGKIPKLTFDQTLHQMAQNDTGVSYLSIFWPIWPKKLTKMERYQNSPWIDHCAKCPEMTLRCHICRYFGQFDPKSRPKWIPGFLLVSNTNHSSISNIYWDISHQNKVTLNLTFQGHSMSKKMWFLESPNRFPVSV